jgi:hypothetical protein
MRAFRVSAVKRLNEAAFDFSKMSKRLDRML